MLRMVKNASSAAATRPIATRAIEVEIAIDAFASDSSDAVFRVLRPDFWILDMLFSILSAIASAFLSTVFFSCSSEI